MDIHSWNTAPFVCYLPYTQGYTAAIVCYFRPPRVIQLHLFVVFHTSIEYSSNYLLFSIHLAEYSFICLLFPIHRGNTASFVCYFPYTEGIQLHLPVIVHTPRGIEPWVDGNNKQLQLYTPGCMVNNKQMELYSMSVW
jgi:hypothetical protein